MARAANRFVCQSCGAVHRKWTGRCDSCNEWNSIVEETAEATVPKGVSRSGGKECAEVDHSPLLTLRRLSREKNLNWKQ